MYTSSNQSDYIITITSSLKITTCCRHSYFCICLRIVMSNTYYVVFLFLFFFLPLRFSLTLNNNHKQLTYPNYRYKYSHIYHKVCLMVHWNNRKIPKWTDKIMVKRKRTQGTNNDLHRKLKVKQHKPH